MGSLQGAGRYAPGMTLNEVDPFANSFRELRSSEPNQISLRCPRCGKTTVRRRDSLAVGLHTVICRNFEFCDFTTDKIVTRTGKIAGKGADDHS